MRKDVLMLLFFMLVSCSSIRFVDSWRNNEIKAFQPNKLLIVGITDNLTARTIFEESLRDEFLKRNIKAEVSFLIFDAAFTNSKKTEEEINKMIEKIANEGFDAVLITAVKGIDEKRSYNQDYYATGYKWTHFGNYYFRFQDVYYTPNYYDSYKVYHIETSIYNIKSQDNKALVWVGSLDLVNPQTVTNTIKDYVYKIIEKLEKEKLITTR